MLPRLFGVNEVIVVIPVHADLAAVLLILLL